MSRLMTWKKLQKKHSSRTRSLDLFLKDEVPDSRRVVNDLFAKKRAIDLSMYPPDVFPIGKAGTSQEG